MQRTIRIEIVMRDFFKGKRIWGYVSGTPLKPQNTNDCSATLIDTWEAIMPNYYLD